MAKKKKKGIFKSIFPKLLLVVIVVVGYYAYQHPESIPFIKSEPTQSVESGEDQAITLSSVVNQEKAASILGKTTSLVEEALKTIKVPKKVTGTEEEIVIQDVVDTFAQKVKNLPQDQVDRIKIQFCQDMLESVENASVVIE